MSTNDTPTDERTDLSTDDACPHGEQWCPGADADALPCFDCFMEAA